jgi:PmbA protein
MSADLLEAARGQADQAEVFEASSDSAEVRFANGAVKNAVARESSGVSVRAIKDGKLGFAGARDTSSEGQLKLLSNVSNSISVGDDARLEFPAAAEQPVDAAALAIDDAETRALGIPQLAALGQKTLDTLKERHPDFVFDATVRRGVGKTHLRNTAGVDAEESYTSFSFSVEANRTRDEDVLMDWVYTGGPAVSGVDLDRLVDDLSRRLTWCETIVELKPGTMPVLFSPEGALVLWGPLASALNGKTVMQETSPLREKLGQTILDPRISLTDDGLLPGASGSSRFDDEGLPRRRTALIEEGVLKSFVHDLETARATGQEPTGNGERGGVMGKPGPGFSNLVVAGGDTSWRDMLKGIDYGLLLHSVIGMGQGNTLPGNISNPVELAFLIEGGEVKGRVKDVSIAGNIYELLGPKHLAGLSSEVEQVYGSYRLPWVLINDMNVVGKASATD